ncbi:MAG TPA: UbiD family decarboxylase [Candidatus Binatia bacterium]|nr:UbiD family decarboxylase [Candidatus Binatia bacterium]
MAYSDLQDFLRRLEAAGKLHWIEPRVDPAWEVTAITRQVFDRYGWKDRPALGFRQVGDSPLPLVIGVIGGSPEIYALALSTSVAKIPQAWEQGQRHPIDPVSVQSGLCKEIVARGAEVDLGILPQVVWTPSQDPGPYITAPVIITKDIETGRRNVGTYRLQLKRPRQLGLYVGPAQHAAKHIRQYESAKKDMPVAVAIGVDPTIVLASISKFPYGTDELSVAGGLRGEPVPMIKCETVDLEVPANAEIVIEGILRSGHREQEGPFGEFSGYMSPGGQQPVIDVTCITRRHAPVYHAFLSQMPPSESSCIRSLGRAAALHHHLRHVIGLPVRDVHFTESGGASSILVISMTKEYPEQVKEVAWGAWSLMNKEGKFTIVVDDDIDVRDPFQVEWAMSFRAQPGRDTFMVNGVVPSGVDPSTAPPDIPQHDPRRRAGSKILIDATRKHTYPPAARIPKEHIAAVQQKWAGYGFTK